MKNRLLVQSGFEPTASQNIAFQADDRLITEKQLAVRWALSSAKKLQTDRLKGCGCPFVKIGAAVRYRLSDVAAYEAANLRHSTSEG